MRQAQAIWLIIKVRESIIRLNKGRKTHDNAITTLDIQGSLGEKANIKVKRSMKLLRKVIAILYKRLPRPKGKMLAWAPNAKQELTRGPMYGQALPFTSCHF